jgi:glutamyl-tRNA synthetase
MLGFLFVSEEKFTVDPEDAARALTPDSAKVLEAAITALKDLPEWDAESIEGALRAALVDGLGLKPRTAFTPVRVAVTGRRVSPPLFESIELLGAGRTLARLSRALGPLSGRGPGPA